MEGGVLVFPLGAPKKNTTIYPAPSFAPPPPPPPSPRQSSLVVYPTLPKNNAPPLQIAVLGKYWGKNYHPRHATTAV